MVIGLLGGIGSGKSAVARLFLDAGARSVDADQLAREALARPETAARVASRFGKGVLGPDGAVDRRALAARVFTDAQALKDLNAIVHPPVRERIREEIRKHRARARRPGEPGSILVLDVALLAESPILAECDALVFVEADSGLRRSRIAARGWPPGEMERRESFQTPIEEKKRMARWTVDNSGPLEATRRDVARVLREIAAAARPEEREGGN